MPVLEVKAGQIRYEVHGTGYPVLLFAPGFLSSRIERWATNPARPGAQQDWLDPIPALQDRFQLIALDVRNAGRSRAKLGPHDGWDTYTRDHPAVLPGFRQRMFGGDFIFSVTREFVQGCPLPMLLMPGNDVVHPASVSADLAKAPHVDVLAAWKGMELRDRAMARVRQFLIAHRP